MQTDCGVGCLIPSSGPSALHSSLLVAQVHAANEARCGELSAVVESTTATRGEVEKSAFSLSELAASQQGTMDTWNSQDRQVLAEATTSLEVQHQPPEVGLWGCGL